MINKYLEQTEKSEVKNWIGSNLSNYLKKNQENQGEIEHILDYLNSDAAPNRLRKMSYIQAKSNAEKWLKANSKKGRNIEETNEDVKIVKRWKNMRLVKLIGENAFKREGFLMGHCVASYYGKSETSVYSLRDSKNMPHATLEVVENNSAVQQIKGKGNGAIHPKYIKYVINILEKVFKMPVRESEMTNLGYEIPPEGYLDFMRKNNLKTLTYKMNNKEFLYVR